MASLSQRHISQQIISPNNTLISDTDSTSVNSNNFNSQNQSQNSTPSYPPEGFIEEGKFYL